MIRTPDELKFCKKEDTFENIFKALVIKETHMKKLQRDSQEYGDNIIIPTSEIENLRNTLQWTQGFDQCTGIASTVRIEIKEEFFSVKVSFILLVFD